MKLQNNNKQRIIERKWYRCIARKTYETKREVNFFILRYFAFSLKVINEKREEK